MKAKRKKNSLLRNGYFVHNTRVYLFVRAIDFFMRFFIHKKIKRDVINPKKILLCCANHLGDNVVISSLLPVIKNKWPDVKIGYLMGSWSKCILENSEFIDEFFYADHWLLNRSVLTRVAKITKYIKMRKKAIQKIKKANYDIAIDFGASFPNYSVLLYQTNIPVTLGFNSGGFGRLFSESYDFVEKKTHILDYHLYLLSKIGLSVSIDERVKMLPFLSHLGKKSTQNNRENKYIIIHPGTGNPVKEWPLNNWIKLVETILSETEYKVFVTGAGEKEYQMATTIIKTFEEYNSQYYSRLKNCVNKLSFVQFCSLLCKADLLIGVDSLAGHLGSAFDIKQIILFAGVVPSNFWSPLGNNTTILESSMCCSPCYQPHGCDVMKCIKDITVDRVVRQTKKIISS